MIKYTGTRDGKPFLGIGLSGSEARLLANYDKTIIAVEGKTLGLCFDVLIVVHEDQDPATLAKALGAAPQT